MQAEEMLFFDGHRDAWPLYMDLRQKIVALGDDIAMEVKKTQISFKNRHLFAAVSFLPVRKAAKRPKAYITVTIGLPHPLTSPRIDAQSEPYPNRWTHHITIGDADEIDEELMAWIGEAAAFASAKR